MKRPTTIYINGKFTAQRTTGVQRLARGLLGGLDEVLASGRGKAGHSWILLCPAQGDVPSLRHIEVQRIPAFSRFLHGWEQIALPWAARRGRLLSFGGTAPVIPRGQGCMLPDAAVFDHGDAYTSRYRTWYRFAYRRVAGKARLAMTISEFSKRRLLETLRLPELRLKVVPCAAEHILKVQSDPAVFQRFGGDPGDFLLAVGSRNPTKNFAALRNAFLALPGHLAARLVLVGGANQAVFAQRGAVAEDPRIVNIGAVSDAELKALYERALAFVFPSTYEGFGIPPLEAMSCGCPVLASRAASIPEVCGDAVLYFDPLSEADMTRAMARVIGDPELRRTLRASGAERAKIFTWRAAGATLLTHLESVGWAAPMAS